MSKKDVDHLIVKYLYNAISASEMDALNEWLMEMGNEEKFREYIEINYAIGLSMTEFNTERIAKNLLQKIKKDKSILNRFKIRNYMKYAALAILFLAMGYFFQSSLFKKVSNETLVPGEGDITLYLEDGGIQIITKGGTAAVHDEKGKKVGEQKADQLKYFKKDGLKKQVFHKLMVPYGKKFELVLSDGTKAYLNSGSSIRYPVSFTDEGFREVYLSGEAFFDVAKDTDNPFVIYADDLAIQVLGTKFNVSSYPEDTTINTVLVEGSVSVFPKEGAGIIEEKSAIILEPGYMAIWNRRLKEMTDEEVDIEMYTSWMGGKIVFNHLAFKDIIKKLERHYNVTIVNSNKALDEEVFTATFDKEPLEEVLNIFSRNFAIKFAIENNKVLIN